jgi:hypothetical protein
MTSEEASSRLHIDSDWKQEAEREKAKLAEDEKRRRQEPQDGGGDGPRPVGFLDLVNLLAMQASIGISGWSGPGEQQMPPDPELAKHHIDLLDVLEKKTEGNLSDEEKRVLSAVAYELRMQFVQAASSPAAGSGRGRVGGS